MIPSAVLRQPVTIEPYLGDSATGPLYGAAVTASAAVESTNAQVVAGDRMTQVVAKANLRPDVECPANSRLTYDGQAFIVVSSMLINQMARPFCRRLQLGRG